MRSALISIGPLFRRVATISGARVLGAGMGLIAQVLLARSLGADGLGVYYWVLSIASVLAVLAGLGLPSIAVRVITQYRVNNQIELAHRFIARSRFYVVLAVGAICLVGVVVVALGHESFSATSIGLMLGLLTALPLVLIRMNGSVANAFKQFNTAYLPDILWRPALIAIVAAFLVVTNMEGGATVFLAVHLVGVLLLAAWQHWRVNSIVAAEPKWTDSPPELEKRHDKWIMQGLAIVPLALFTAVFGDVVVAVAAPLLTLSQLAVFGVCLKIALLSGFVIQVSQQIMLPDAAKALAEERPRDLQRQIAGANALGLACCTIMTLVLAVVGDKILAVFGPEFVEGQLCLVVLSLSQVARAAMGPGSHMLVLTGNQRATLPVSAVGVGSLVVACLVLIPIYGLVGAALAVVISTMVWCGWLARLSKREAGVSTVAFAGRFS